jgi:hypothetical protein
MCTFRLYINFSQLLIINIYTILDGATEFFYNPNSIIFDSGSGKFAQNTLLSPSAVVLYRWGQISPIIVYFLCFQSVRHSSPFIREKKGHRLNVADKEILKNIYKKNVIDKKIQKNK